MLTFKSFFISHIFQIEISSSISPLSFHEEAELWESKTLPSKIKGRKLWKSVKISKPISRPIFIITIKNFVTTKTTNRNFDFMPQFSHMRLTAMLVILSLGTPNNLDNSSGNVLTEFSLSK